MSSLTSLSPTHPPCDRRTSCLSTPLKTRSPRSSLTQSLTHSSAVFAVQTKINSIRNEHVKGGKSCRRHDLKRMSSERNAVARFLGSLTGSVTKAQLLTEETELTSGGGVQKAVKFDAVCFRVFEVSVDDNTGVSKGPAIALSWNFIEKTPIPLDEYEMNREPRRGMQDLKLTAAERQKILKDSGATQREIMQYVKKTNIARRKRHATIERMNNGVPEEAIEDFVRGVKRLFGMKKSSKHEMEKLWKNVGSSSSAATKTPLSQ